MKRSVVGIGEVLWDIFPQGEKLGGAPANFVYHTTQYCLNSILVSSVGKDSLGHKTRYALDDKGVSSLISEVDSPTGRVEVTLDDAGVPQYDIKEPAAWDFIPFTDELQQLAERTEVVCFGTLAQRSAISRATIGRFVDIVASRPQSWVVYDINIRQAYWSLEVIEASLWRCNILKINDEELEQLRLLLELEDRDIHDICTRIMSLYGVKILILTCGVNGSYVMTADKTLFRPTPIVTVKDTVGAGDSFTAAFVASLIHGSPLEECHSKAVETSAYVCTQEGAMPRLPQSLTHFVEG